jgi:hypothetical protein
LARFQGDVNKGSDRAAATVLFVLLLALMLLAIWHELNPAAFDAFFSDKRSRAQRAHSLPKMGRFHRWT